MRRPERARLAAAFATSAALHAVGIALVWLAASAIASEPVMRVYAVDIVSPPPTEAGEFTPEQPVVAEPEPDPVEEEPEPEPEPEPDPEPAPPPEKKPAEKPPEKKPEPPKKSTGAEPEKSSPGGENLDVRTEGARFVQPAYLENIVRQVNRYFRRPAGSRTDEAEVRFWINRNGSVSDIEVVQSSGSFRFRLAAMEAIEQAGLNKAFGPLPKEYPADRLPVSFYFRPAR